MGMRTKSLKQILSKSHQQRLISLGKSNTTNETADMVRNTSVLHTFNGSKTAKAIEKVINNEAASGDISVELDI